jgi:hypothetical protein
MLVLLLVRRTRRKDVAILCACWEALAVCGTCASASQHVKSHASVVIVTVIPSDLHSHALARQASPSGATSGLYFGSYTAAYQELVELMSIYRYRKRLRGSG